MSLPTPQVKTIGNPNTTNTTTTINYDIYDAPLIALTNVCNGDLRQLLYAFFNFLHRRTDFYIIYNDTIIDDQTTNTNTTTNNNNNKNTIGFKLGDAEKLLLASFKQFPLRKIPSKHSQQMQQQQTHQKTHRTNSTSTVSETKNTTIGVTNDTAVITSNDSKEIEIDKLQVKEETETLERTSTTTVAKEEEISVTPSISYTNNTNNSNNSIIRYTDNGLQIPVGNGGNTKHYTWTQTMDECTVILHTKFNERSKELNVQLTNNTITISSKINKISSNSTNETNTTTNNNTNNHNFVQYLNGTFVNNIIVSESTWTIESNIIIVVLYKKNKSYWNCILQEDVQQSKHNTIDITLIDSKQYISSYDNNTQCKIRQIIFDQNQYHNNLPTSTEILAKSKSNSTSTSSSNTNQPITIPPLPDGVEYINQETIDKNVPTSNNNNKNKKK